MLRWIVCLACMLGVSLAADLNGTWKVSAKMPNGREVGAVLTLRQEEGKVSGSIGNEEGTVQLDDVKLVNNELTFQFEYEGTYKVKLKQDGTAMAGTFTAPNGSSGQVRATR